MTVSDRIKSRREELKMTQDELAKRLGLKGKSSVCKIENAGDNVSSKSVKRYAIALNCSPAHLMGWDQSSSNEPNQPSVNASNQPAAPASSPVAPVQLRQDETELLDKYNMLNDIGRNKAYEYVSDLTENEKYIQGLEELNRAV